MIYEYPVVISYSASDNVYYVNFPDLKNCFTDGETLREALDNAEDVLNLILSHRESKGDIMPAPSALKSLNLGVGEIVALVKTDTGEERK